jgi:nicotinamidase-related amidase
MTLNTEQLVLVVVDMQNGFLGRKANHILPSVLRLVQEFRKRGLPIVFSRFHNAPGSQYERLIGWTRLRFSPEVDISLELEQYAETVIDKEIYSVFTPVFASMVERRNWHNIALCGVATDGCVLKTAVDAFERGLTPIVVTDACASHAGEDVHRSGLQLLERFVGKEQLVDAGTLLAAIDGEKRRVV